MKRRTTRYILMILLPLIFVVTSFSLTIAYFTATGTGSSNFTMGTINVTFTSPSSQTSNLFTQDDVYIDDLVYVDFEKDIMKNEGTYLDNVATYFDISMRNNGTTPTIPVDVTCSLTFASAQEANSIVALLIPYDSSCYTTYYDTFLRPLYTANANIDDFKNALLSKNNQVVNDSTITFTLIDNQPVLYGLYNYRIVLFVDYDISNPGSNNLEGGIHSFNHNYTFDIDVTCEQHH